MIDYKDIKTAVNEQLKKLEIDIQARDVQKGFSRPSLFVELDNAERSGTTSQVYRTLTVRIYYFPKSKYEYAIDVLEKQDEVENLFDLKLAVKDRLLNVEDFTSSLSDGVLQFSFDIEFYQGRKTEEDFVDEDWRERHPIEDMEKLYYEQE